MIDIIVCHPRDVLFPWWNRMITQNRHLFGKVFIIMTQSNSAVEYTNYLEGTLPQVTVIENYHDDGIDWRNAAIHEALKQSTGEHILFLEQDFLFMPGFLSTVINPDVNTIGFYEGKRLHPAFLLVKRNVLHNTRMDFSVDPDKGDHFSKLTTDLEKLGDIHTLHNTDDWIHLAGTTQNYRMTANWYNPQVFYQYNHLSLELPQHPYWKEYCKRKEQEMGNVSPHETINLERFFL